MLWAQDDPAEVLRDRFGFADAEAVGDWVTSTVERHWGVRVGSQERVVISDSNALAWLRAGDDRLLLKWSVARDRFERLAFAATVTASLGTLGLPVSTPVPTLEGEVQVTSDGVSVGLQRVIEGSHLDVGDPDQVRAAGAMLARLHDALREHPLRNSPPEFLSVPTPLTEQVAGWVTSNPSALPPKARDVLGQMLERALADLPPLQIVQGDYRAANICASAVLSSAFSTSRSSGSITESSSSLVRPSCSARSSGTGGPSQLPFGSSSWTATKRSKPSPLRNLSGGRSSCSGTRSHSCLPAPTRLGGVEPQSRYSTSRRRGRGTQSR
ncbi:phosphotransferase [Curtobacterium sp. L1-20]|uniref:phosphotransferase n=1 Tax=Curtobacterium sp. L1-20 TaxID=3138181 RepID=UPI003B52810B